MKKLLAVALIAIGSTTAAAEQATLKVSDAYVRGMPPGRTVTAAFFELSNEGETSCHLVSAETSIAERAELHTHIHEDGLMKMREVKRIEVPAGESLSFKPGGLHIMLFGVQSLKDVQEVEMILHFEDCDDLTVSTKVRHLGG